MSAVDNIRAQQGALAATEAELIRAVKAGIREGLDKAFEDPEIKNVVFGVSTDPYNDENAGQGVYGPYTIDTLEYEDDFTRTEAYALFYDRTGDRPAALYDLAEVLKIADWKHAGAALGVTYYEGEGSGNESAFVARRKEQPELDGKAYTFTEYDQGY